MSRAARRGVSRWYLLPPWGHSAMPSHLPPASTWNLYHCGVSAAVLNNTAKSMHDSGLAAAGFEYVNSDGEPRVRSSCREGSRKRPEH